MRELLHSDAVPFLDGDRHRTRKRLLLSAFTAAAMDSYLPSIFAICARFSAFVPQGGGPPDGHRCAGEALIRVMMPAFVGWLTRRYDIALPGQDTRSGRGGVGPMPRDGLRASITKRV